MFVKMLGCAALAAMGAVSAAEATPVVGCQPVAAQPVYVAQSAPQLRAAVIPRPPKGWKMAWADDRLTPLRGYSTVEGEAQQDQVWQRSVPMVRVTDRLPKQSGLGGVLGLRVSVATMSAPTGPVSAAQSIQVGSFSVVANAQSTAARLAGMGLPVSTATSTRGGKVIKTVYVGPFASAAEARTGLSLVHSAGFPDASLR